MKILIKIQATTALLCHEALSLAFALAAFDHEIQLWISDVAWQVFAEDKSEKLTKMLSSLEMYDMPPAWLDAAVFSQLSTTEFKQTYLSQLCALPKENMAEFDLTLYL